MPHGKPVDITAIAPAKVWEQLQSHTGRMFGWGSLRIMVTDDDVYDASQDPWRHVSFSCKNRYPTWDELLAVRYEFFPPDVEVIQVFPPQAEYVNLHKFALHLWWNKARRLTPPMMKESV